MPDVDERVVTLEFDNSEFDPEVKKSQKTLEEFEKSLDPKAFDKYAKNLNSQDFKPLNNNLAALGNTFKTVETIATGALLNIGMKLENTLSSSIRKMTIDPMVQGWTAYGEKVTSVQTIMAATRNKFVEFADAVDRGDESVQNFIASQETLVTGAKIMENQMSYVNDQLDQLMAFTDETSASYGVMVNNIGKFTSQNIDLQTSVKAMEGIATWANLSGANAEQMARAMYNISQSLGVGKMLTRDWMSIENANMATVEFKEAAIDAAVELGVLKRNADGVAETLDGKTKVAVNNFRDTLSGDWFTGDVMMGALDKYGRFAQEIVKAANETDVTVRDIMDAVDEISGVEDQTEAIEAFIKDMEVEGEAADTLRESLKKLSSQEYDLGKRAFRAAYESKTLADAVGYVGDAIRTGWIKSYELIVGDYEEARKFWTEVAEVLYTLFVEAGEVRNKILALWKSAEGRNDLIEALKNIRDFFLGTKGEPGLLDIFKQILGEFFPQLKSETSTVNFFAKVLLTITRMFRNFSENLRKNPEIIEKITKVIRTVVRVLKFTWEIIRGIAAFFGPTIRWTKQLFKSISKLISPLADGAEGAMDFVEGLKAIRTIFLTLGAVVALPIKLLQNFIDWLSEIGNSTLPDLETKIGTWWDNVWRSITDFVKNVFTLGKNIIDGFSKGLENGWSSLEEFVGGLFQGLIDIVKNVLGIHSPSTVFIAIGAMILGGLIVGITQMQTPLAQTLQSVLGIINGFATEVLSIVTRVLIAIAIAKAIKAFKALAKFATATFVPELFESIGSFFRNAGEALTIYAKQKFRAEVIKSVGKTALMIAGAITMIAAAIAVIAALKLDDEELKKAAAVLGASTGALALMAFLLGLFQKIFATNRTSYEMTMGGELFKKIGIDAKKAGVSANGMSSGILAMSRGLLLIGMSLSILMFTIASIASIMKHNEVTVGDMWLIIAMMGALVVFFSGLVAGFMGINKGLKSENFLIEQMTSFSKFMSKMTRVLRRFALSIAGIAGIAVLLRNLSRAASNGWKTNGNQWQEDINYVMNTFLEFLLSFGLILSGFGAIDKFLGDSNKAVKNMSIMAGVMEAMLAAFAGVLYLIKRLGITSSELSLAQLMLFNLAAFTSMFIVLERLFKTLKVSATSNLGMSAIMSAIIASLLMMTYAIKILNDIKPSLDALAGLAVLSLLLIGLTSFFAVLTKVIKDIPWAAIFKLTLIVGIANTAIITLASALYIVAEAMKAFTNIFPQFINAIVNFRAMSEHVQILWTFVGIAGALFLASLFLGLAAPGFLVFAGAWATFTLALYLTARIVDKIGKIILRFSSAISNAIVILYGDMDLIEKMIPKMKELFTTDLLPSIYVLGELGKSLIWFGIGGRLAAGAITLMISALSTMALALDPIKKVVDFIRTIGADVGIACSIISDGIWDIGMAVLITAPGVIVLASAILLVAVAVWITGDNINRLSNMIDLITNKAEAIRSIMETVSAGIMAAGIALITAGIGAAVFAIGLGLVAVSTLALIINMALFSLALLAVNGALSKVKEDNKDFYDKLIDFFDILLDFLSVITDLIKALVPLAKIIGLIGEAFFLVGKIVLDSLERMNKDGKFDSTLKLFGSLWEIIDGINGVLGDFVSWIGKALTELGKFFGFIKDNEPTYDDFASTTNTIMSGDGRTFTGGSRHITEGAADGIKKGTSEYEKAISNMSNAGADAFRKANGINSPSRLYRDMAEEIPAGAATGIADNAKEAVNAIHSLSKGMENEFRDYNGIHSASDLYSDLGAEIPAGAGDGVEKNAEEAIDAVRKMVKAAEDAAEIDVDPAKYYKNKYVQDKEQVDAAKDRYEDSIEDQTLGGALGNIWEDIKRIFKEVKDGKITIGDGLGQLLESLKVHGGTFLGEKLDALKNLLFGDGGPLSGLADLLKNPFGSFEDIFKDLDPSKIVKSVEDALAKLDLTGGANGNLPDMSGLGNLSSAYGQGRQDQYIFTQNNYSPKALSRLEIYRQTRRQFNEFRVREELAK